jgi:hypothetical protein
MNRQDIAYVLNSTPKYFYLLPLHLGLLRRYAKNLKWPLYFGTELPEHEALKDFQKEMKIIKLEEKDKYFLESRLATIKALPSEIQYIFPIQEDFLLEREPNEKALEEAIEILDTDLSIAFIRLMPCPGPRDDDEYYRNSKYFKILGEKNTMMYTFQATLWRRKAFEDFYEEILKHCDPNRQSFIPQPIQNLTYQQKKKFIEVDWNISENSFGQGKFREILGSYNHLAYTREHPSPNAVYMCPWPYRPTAVEKGVLGSWVPELAKREGFPLEIPK